MEFLYNINWSLPFCFMCFLFLLSIFVIIKLKIKIKQKDNAEKYFNVKKLVWCLSFLSFVWMLYYFFRWWLLNFTDVYISNILNYCILIVFSLLFLILIIFVICKKEFKVLFIFCLILSAFILFVEMISLFSYRKSDDYYIEKYNHFEQKRMNCLKKCMYVDNYNLSNFKEWYKFNYWEEPSGLCSDDMFVSYDVLSCYSWARLFQDSFSEDEKIKIQEEISCKNECWAPLLPGNWLPKDSINYLKEVFD